MIGAGPDLGYTVGDTVVFKEFPSFNYVIDQILDNGETVLATDGDVSGFALPSEALRKATDEDDL